MVGIAGQLRLELDAAVGVARVVLDRVREDLVVADQRDDVVRRIERSGEQADFLDRAGHAGDRDEIAHLERPQHDQERPGREVGQQPRPCHADRHARRRDQRRERRGLDAEVAQDADHQQDVQRDGDDRADIAQHGRVHLLVFQRTLHQPHRQVDQPAADDPEGDRRQDLHSDIGGVLRHDCLVLACRVDGGVHQVFSHGVLRGSRQNVSTIGNATTVV